MGLSKKSANCGLAWINVTKPHTAVVIQIHHCAEIKFEWWGCVFPL